MASRSTEGNRVDFGWQIEDLHRGIEDAHRQRQRKRRELEIVSRILAYPQDVQAGIVDAWKRGIAITPREDCCFFPDAPESLRSRFDEVALDNMPAALEDVKDFHPNGIYVDGWTDNSVRLWAYEYLITE